MYDLNKIKAERNRRVCKVNPILSRAFKTSRTNNNPLYCVGTRLLNQPKQRMRNSLTVEHLRFDLPPLPE